MTERIDAHLHLWRRADGYYWLAGELDRDVTAEDAASVLRESGIDGAVLVQADDTAADTRAMLAAAAENTWVRGVVGWVPLDDPASARTLLDEWTGHPALKGVRQLLHTDPRPGLLESTESLAVLRWLADEGLTLDIPDAWPRLLGPAARIAAAVPELTVVIDHLGKPPTDTAQRAAWAAGIREAAVRPNVVAKVSGLHDAATPFTAESVRPVWEAALAAFGTSRLLYGGDWPMTEPHGGYPRAWAVYSELIGELSASEQDDLLWRSATRTYGLEL